jgi:hypothetical protein
LDAPSGNQRRYRKRYAEGFRRLFSRFVGKNRIFPVIFRGQILRCGMILILLFLRRIEFKRVKNNLQGFREYLYPWGV